MKKELPKINVLLNKELDVLEIFQFAQEGDPYVMDWFPQLKDVAKEDLKHAIEEVVNKVYFDNKEKMMDKIIFLKSQLPSIRNAMIYMSEICDENWHGIETINAYIGINPIAPRNLQERYFMIPFHETESSLLAFCAHELLHFIYFKKWNSVFNDKYEDYEYPHKTWVLSEILAPVILSEKRLQRLIPSATALYPHWNEFDKKYKLLDIFKEEFNKRKNFEEFLKKSKDIYSKLDRDLNLTFLMTK